jgi:DNA-binding transcriptional regulator LsrR (DeoR family)
VTSAVRSRPVSAEDAEVLASIAEDYYVNGDNQDAIATRHRISRSYVSRLLRRARELGIVEISVRRDIRRDPALEVALRERYALERCMVVASESSGPEVVLRRAGQVAANLLSEVVTPESTVALSWGNGVRAVVEALRPGRIRARHVVQMFGGLSTAPTEILSGELVAEAARDLGATHDRLHAPWIVESAELARALLEQQDIAAVLQRAAKAQVAVVGIGATGSGSSSLLFNETYLSPAELAEIHGVGAVGDICGRMFDTDGRPCRPSLMDRVIGLDLDAIRQLPLVIGIATGAHKHRAVRAALRGRLVHALVTDSEVAGWVLADG